MRQRVSRRPSEAYFECGGNLAGALVAVVLALASGSCTGASEQISSASPTAFASVVPLSHARISALYLFPYPEGPPAYFCPHPEQMIGVSTCLRLYRSQITDALGAPAPWPSPLLSKNDCQTGWTMKVIFVDRTRLVYGPCEHPSSVVSLHDALLQGAASDRAPGNLLTGWGQLTPDVPE